MIGSLRRKLFFQGRTTVCPKGVLKIPSLVNEVKIVGLYLYVHL